MVKGRNPEQQSVIEREGLVALILELHSLGYNYTQIIAEVQKRRNITISKSALTRFFNKHRQIGRDYNDNYYRAIGEYSIDLSDRIRRMVNDTRKATMDWKDSIDNCDMPTNQKYKLKRQTDKIMRDLLEEYGNVEHDTMSLMILLRKNHQSVGQFITEISAGMCPRCREVILNCIKEFEENK